MPPLTFPLYMTSIIDLHQDLLLYVTRSELYNDTEQTGFEMIKKNNLKVVTASAFPVPQDEDFLHPFLPVLIEGDLKAYGIYVKENPEYTIIKNITDLHDVFKTEGKFGLLLHVEGLNVFDTKTGWETLEQWYSLGLRSIGPVWNVQNPFGGGTKDLEQGLTSLGAELLEWCEEKQLLFDCAHMNEKTFWDITKSTKRPLLVSHGNTAQLCPSPRNYTDEQIRTIGESGGVIGVFFSKKFITPKDTATLEDITAHIEHIKNIAGEDAVALGTDFGGIISGFAEGMESVEALQGYLENFNSSFREKLGNKNALRVLEAHLS